MEKAGRRKAMMMVQLLILKWWPSVYGLMSCFILIWDSWSVLFAKRPPFWRKVLQLIWKIITNRDYGHPISARSWHIFGNLTVNIIRLQDSCCPQFLFYPSFPGSAVSHAFFIVPWKQAWVSITGRSIQVRLWFWCHVVSSLLPQSLSKNILVSRMSP